MGNIHSANQGTDLEILNDRINTYRKQGLMKDVEKAADRSRGRLREWIESQHPQYAFFSRRNPNGINLIIDNYNSQTHHQTVLGSHNVVGSIVNANIYANYYQRWANTGVRGGDPEVRWWAYNQNAMQEKFVQYLDEELDKIVPNSL